MSDKKIGRLIKSIPEKAKEILNIIKYFPGINSKNIQDKLNIESGNTFTRYVKILLENELIEEKRNKQDKRQKYFTVTDLGRRFQLFIDKEVLGISLKTFYKYCEILFLHLNPEFEETPQWFVLKRTLNNSPNDLNEMLKEKVFQYMTNYLKSIILENIS